MADEKTSPGQPVRSEGEGSDLSCHEADGRAVVLHIGGRFRKTEGHSVLGIFHVREIDINQSIEKLDHGRGIISVGIIDDWNGEPFLACQDQAMNDLGNHMAWCHKVDIVGALPLEGEEDLPEFCGIHLPAIPVLAYREVLAEVAGQIAVGEEDRSRSPRTGEAGFLSKMEVGGAETGPETGTAGSGLPLKPVDPTISRTDMAGTESFISLDDPKTFFFLLNSGKIRNSSPTHGSFPAIMLKKAPKTFRASWGPGAASG